MIKDNQNFLSNNIKSFFEKEFYKWLTEGLRENPNLLIELCVAEDMYMGLGLYIRNQYIYNNKVKKEVSAGNISFDLMCFPDNYSGVIIDLWQDLGKKIQETQTKCTNMPKNLLQ